MTPDPQAILVPDVDPDTASQVEPDMEVDVAVDEVLVEEVSIDGLCGVY